MGEIADMMIDGTLCCGCGVYIGVCDDFPCYCSNECAHPAGVTDPYLICAPDGKQERDTSKGEE